MNELFKLIKEVGDEIQPKLLPKPGHRTRQAQAHLFGMIRALCGTSYSEADPNKVRAVVEAIRNNPNGKLKTIYKEAKEIYKGSK